MQNSLLNNDWNRVKWKKISPHYNANQEYEISKLGTIRFLGKTGYIPIKRFIEDGDFYTTIRTSYGEKKLLVYELMAAVWHFYSSEDRIILKNGNKLDVSFYNISVKKKPTKTFYKIPEDIKLIQEYKCDEKANSANNRVEKTDNRIDGHDVLSVLKITNFKCFYCDKQLSGKLWQLDHYVPISKKGANDIKNLTASCRHCNMMKNDMVGDEFFKRAKIIYLNYKKYHSEKIIKQTRIIKTELFAE